MDAVPGRAHGVWGLAGVVGCLVLTAAAAAGWADTVRLKNGNTIEGDIVRSDGTQVTIVVKGQPQFFAADEVESVVYSHLRIIPPPVTSFHGSPAREPARVDSALLTAVGDRAQALHALGRRMRDLIENLQRDDDWAALETAQVTIQEILPIRHGRFTPLYALADVLILLGVRAPTVWLALLLVKEPRAMIRIAEFLMVAYGLTMLLMAWTLSVDVFWVTMLVIPIASGIITCLFAWMFSLRPRRAVSAFLLAVGMNLGIEYLLTAAHLI